MSNANITMSYQCDVDTLLEESISIYVDENWVLKQKNSDGCEYTIYCSNE